jgi:MoaA/NifB/PqqE/SkfB family radical SAM enzyme
MDDPVNLQNSIRTFGIEVKVTDHCNQRCFHCVNNDNGRSGKNIDHDLIIDRLFQWRRSSNNLLNIREVRFTGGEPILNLPAMIKMVRCCNEVGIRSGVNTNGSMITTDVASRLKSAGITVMKVSLDAMSKDIHQQIRGVDASFEASLNGIKVAVDEGFKVIARFTLCHLNSSQLVDCYKFAEKAGVSKFQVKPLINSGRARGCGHFLTNLEIRSILKNFSEKIVKDKMIPEILCLPQDDTLGMQTKACGSIDKIYISTDGKVRTCNFLSSGWEEGLTSYSFEEIVSSRISNVIPQKFNGDNVLPGCPQYSSG